MRLLYPGYSVSGFVFIVTDSSVFFKSDISYVRCSDKVDNAYSHSIPAFVLAGAGRSHKLVFKPPSLSVVPSQLEVIVAAQSSKVGNGVGVRGVEQEAHSRCWPTTSTTFDHHLTFAWLQTYTSIFCLPPFSSIYLFLINPFWTDTPCKAR